jgi:hypothetical protein
MPARPDVIVAGLGAVGSAALYQLARRGVPALGIDRFQPPHANGSPHGESRITRLALGEGPSYVQFARRAHAIWRELIAARHFEPAPSHSRRISWRSSFPLVGEGQDGGLPATSHTMTAPALHTAVGEHGSCAQEVFGGLPPYTYSAKRYAYSYTILNVHDHETGP